MRIKKWMVAVIVLAALLGVAALFSGIYLVIASQYRYINADPQRLDGAKSCLTILGYGLGGLTALALVIKTVACVGASAWKFWSPQLSPARAIRHHVAKRSPAS